ncbi:ATP-binding protein [Pelagicoccus mobilis]|uniref:histidine kinase n=1 Tax=Pelagicoccus mobilis TaxID=415221 RepID=A0A934RRD6_9BACT|nr:ATP-binding protein [Pelagicoccus mobilis]MBK1876145.1 hypothetical protein [Pelagicoccus mobilis]
MHDLEIVEENLIPGFLPYDFIFESAGVVWLHGEERLVRYDPSVSVPEREDNPGCLVTHVSVSADERVLYPAGEEPLVLPYSKSSIIVHFLANRTLFGESAYFEVRLGQREGDWVSVGSSGSTVFNDLKEGTYRIQVRSVVGDTVGELDEILLLITPPWYRTWWAYLGAAVLICSLVAVGFRLYDAFRKMEQRRLEELVTQRTAELEAAKNAAEESDRLKTSFLQNMSHEIRTPMNAIVGYASLFHLEDEEFTKGERIEYSHAIKNNCESLLTLIDDILDVSVIEAGQLRISSSTFDANELLRDLSVTFSVPDKSSDSPVRLVFHEVNHGEPFLITSDSARLRQILVNLITNALKFTVEGTVDVRLEKGPGDDHVTFKVVDTGIGIEERNLEAIWERFRKIEDDNSVLFRGAGLGLAITRSLVDLLGGTISVESKIGQGSRFVVVVPCGLLLAKDHA